MSEQYITKAYRQRTSLVTSIPIQVRTRLELNKGDHLVWQVRANSEFVQIFKVPTGGNKNDGAKGNFG